MNTTVAVSLITALSTLAGASVSGYIALLIAKNQRREAHFFERLQIRRDAFLQFLNQVNAMNETLEALWMSKPPPKGGDPNEFVQPVRQIYGELLRACDLVRLEGNEELSSMAVNLTNQLSRESVQLGVAARDAEPNRVISDQYAEMFKAECERRHKARGAIIKRARLYLATQDG